MNVLFVANVYSEFGIPSAGTPFYIYKISLALKQMGHQPFILAAGTRESYRVENGIPIWIIHAAPLLMKKEHISYLINSLRKSYFLNQWIEEIVKTNIIDVIQFVSLDGVAFFYDLSIPSVMRLSSYACTYFSTFSTFSKEMVNCMGFLERNSSKMCDLIFAPAYVTANAFSRDLGRGVQVIETPFFNDVKELDSYYLEKYLARKKYVLFFGTLYVEKGICVIAEILEKFLLDYPDYHFVFIGESRFIHGEIAFKYIKRMAGTASNRVIIFDNMSHQRLYPIIQSADFVVMPSLMDNFPNACVEAMHFKKIVIGTRGATFEQLIVDGINGLLCEIGDSASLLCKMNMVVNMSAVERERIETEAGRSIERLNPNFITMEIVDFYEKAMVVRKKHFDSFFNVIEVIIFTLLRRLLKILIQYPNMVLFLFGDLQNLQMNANKNFDILIIVKRWIMLKQKMKTIEQYLEKKQYFRVAIYGMGHIGILLCYELQNSKIEVIYGIDRKALEIDAPVDVFFPNEGLPMVDAIISTVTGDSFAIHLLLRKYISCPILSIEDILDVLESTGVGDHCIH